MLWGYAKVSLTLNLTYVVEVCICAYCIILLFILHDWYEGYLKMCYIADDTMDVMSLVHHVYFIKCCEHRKGVHIQLVQLQFEL